MDSPHELWKMIIVTCPSSYWAKAIQKELTILQKKQRIHENTVCLALDDPVPQIGSGGATLNALLVAAEYWSSLQGYTSITVDVLLDTDILIVHHGRDFLYDPCGRGFAPVLTRHGHDQKGSGITTNLEYLINFWAEIKRVARPGIWVSSSDMYIEFYGKISLDTFPNTEAVIFSVPSSVSYAANHGVVVSDPQGFVKNIVYCGMMEDIAEASEEDGQVPLVCGGVYFSLKVAESLLSLHCLSPVDSCTYFGIDTGEKPLRVSLFFDMLAAMGTGVSEDDFCLGKCGLSYSNKHGLCTAEHKTITYARRLMWKELRHYKMGHQLLRNARYVYISDELPLSKAYGITMYKNDSAHFFTAPKPDGNFHLINSLILTEVTFQPDGKQILMNSVIRGDGKLFLGANSFVSGMELVVPETEEWKLFPNIALLGFPTFFTPTTCALLGIHDHPKLPWTDSQATILNKDWNSFFNETGIEECDLWEKEPHSLHNAKLYPLLNNETDWKTLLWLQEGDKSKLELWRSSRRMSLKELSEQTDSMAAFEWRRTVYGLVTSNSIRKTMHPPEGDVLLPYFRAACAEGWSGLLLSALDEAASSGSFGRGQVARLLAAHADLLACMAGPIGGLRSGPAANPAWQDAFRLLQEGHTSEGVCALSCERANWMDTPSKLVRAARHYEGASRILIRQAVMSAKKCISLRCEKSLLSRGVWVVAECPARVDLMGGWSDTPPICYEQGGCVVNMAILVDGKRPIGARACKIEAPVIKMVLGEDCAHQLHLEITVLEDLHSYNNPGSPGALLKAALLCAEVIDLNGPPLEEQLQKYGGGLEVHSWSDLPQGSGLGTSSILAAAVISVLWTVTGRSLDQRSLLHAVLCLEQLLTTGGGWQDQVGGILGGIKRGFSPASDEMKIEVEHLTLTDCFLEKLNTHLVMMYSGKVRLARNLLQNVIRNWYARDEATTQCFRELVANAAEGAESLKQADLEKLGHCMNVYWEQKKTIASGCEPRMVKEIMDHIRPLAHGQILAGAGGGGFMLVLTKQPNDGDRVQNAIKGIQGSDKVTFHKVHIDTEGLLLTVDGQKVQIPYKFECHEKL